MLVLTRKSREAVMVGGADGLERLLKVTVLEITPGRVKLGFEADRGVAIHRGGVGTSVRHRPARQLGARPRGARHRVMP